ncbi:MFS transporter [Candidatus Bathyarchaeota archaeon]|nr:MFS transporter [Candidatus Bathyarchaeota archaeon]
MIRNVKIIFVSGLFSAFVTGIFELLFPFFLESRKLSLVDMGLIFSVSTLVISFLSILHGEYADVHGRKKIYLASCSLGIVSKTLFPFTLNDLQILFAKFLSDSKDNLRISVHNIMLYENVRENYAKYLSLFTTIDFVLQASGAIFFGFFLSYLGFSGLFFILAAVELAKLFLFFFYRECDRKNNRRVSIRRAYSFKINRNLFVLALSSAISSLGFGIAHGFLLPLYFHGKYGLDVLQISAITVLHRLAFMTTPLAGEVIKKLGLRKTFILSTSSYAFSFLAIGFYTFPIPAFVALFLVHDLIGGGIGMTAMSVMTQTLTDDETRARQINTFGAIQTPVTILAPSISGMLAAMSWDYIFVAGGLLYFVSLSIFIALFKDEALKTQRNFGNK